MRLSLQGFRCHQQAEIVLTPGSLTLIKGPSGIGKSTLFQAIFWCLYGHMNHVYSNTAPQKCSVTLAFDHLPVLGPGRWTFYRQKKPELFRISHDTEKYEDAVAESIVESTFGPRDLWMSCCYLSQGNRCALLMASQADKMDLLNRLSFCADDPDEFIRPIETALTQVTSDFTALQESYTRECEQLQRDAATLVMTRFIPPENRASQQEELLRCQKERVQLHQEFLEYQKNLGIQSSLRHTQMELQRHLQTWVIPDVAEIRRLEENLEILTRMAPQYQQAEKLRHALTLLGPDLMGPVEPIPVTDEDIVTARLAQQHYDTGKAACDALKCEYTTEAISGEIERLQKLLDVQPQLQLHQQIKTLQERLRNLAGPIITDEMVLLAQDDLRKLQMSRNIMKCPHCLKPVRAMNQILVPGESEPASSEAIILAQRRVDELLQQRRQCQERHHVSEELAKLDATVDSQNPISGSLLSPLEVLATRNRLQGLNRITVVPKPLRSPEVLMAIRKRQLAEHRFQEISKELATLPQDNPDAMNRVTSLKRDLIARREQRTRAETMQHQLNDVTTRLDALELSMDSTISERLDGMTQRIQQIQEDLVESQRIDECLRRQSELERSREKLLGLQEEMTNLQRLKTVALEVECHALQGTVDAINVALADIATALFDEPITISLNLFKTAKTTQRTKPSVNLSISYKAGEYDTINQLSGGEADRISLALVLALARLNSFPLLLLDECMASLDGNLRETCLRAIRQTLGNHKTVLAIAHENVEGHYDHVIGIDSAGEITTLS